MSDKAHPNDLPKTFINWLHCNVCLKPFVLKPNGQPDMKLMSAHKRECLKTVVVD